jgi:hydrogenase maturation protein HypF
MPSLPDNRLGQKAGLPATCGGERPASRAFIDPPVPVATVTDPSTDASAIDVLLRVRGTVQGVGFRPFVHRTATHLGLRGWVRNDAHGVLIRASGSLPQLGLFVEALTHAAPPAARVTGVEPVLPGPEYAPVSPDFVIADSSVSNAQISAAVPADLALCADCRRELENPANRRHRYPFINCTQCGPRYSLIESLPYDRPRTTMRVFRLCPSCQQEYENPQDRRFHAEPNACPVCGPQLVLSGLAGQRLAAREVALRTAAAQLREGLIVAVKGVGGYHLMCDATNEVAVTRLRRRKRRDEKPFAVMFRSLEQLRRFADVSAEAAALLISPAAPIVLVPRHTDGTGDAPRPARLSADLASGVAPGNPWIGALLPYAPLHVLLLALCDQPLVATSANLSEEPLCTDNAEAHQRLAGIADLFLEHDRPIARPVDDSVLRLATPQHPIILRRARGYAPAPLMLPGTLPAPLLCVGGQLKNTVAIAADRQLVLSPHLGDLGNLAAQELFERTIHMLGDLHGAHFSAVVHDKHPDYSSSLYANRTGLPRIAVQHHLAHVLACLLEHSQPADNVLGIAWDGTGYGEDGTVWGGEFILLQQNRAERFARLRPFRLPGGEAAVCDARRVALGLAHELGTFREMAARFHYTDRESTLLGTMLSDRINAPLCSSAGRLFDAVGALLGLGLRNSCEGQIPLAVEAAAVRTARNDLVLPFEIHPDRSAGARFEVDWEPALAHLLKPQHDPTVLAAAFHRGLAQAMVTVAREAQAATVVLTGGCFQNALLHTLATEALEAAGFRVLAHRVLPPNDNSIAAGQAVAALWNLTTVELPGSSAVLQPAPKQENAG